MASMLYWHTKQFPNKKIKMKKYQISKFLLLIVISVFFCMNAKSQEKQEDKINASTQVLKDFGAMKESIPSEL